MENAFSDRITDVPKSFIREILKVTIDASIISFAIPRTRTQFVTPTIFRAIFRTSSTLTNLKGSLYQ